VRLFKRAELEVRRVSTSEPLPVQPSRSPRPDGLLAQRFETLFPQQGEASKLAGLPPEAIQLARSQTTCRASLRHGGFHLPLAGIAWLPRGLLADPPKLLRSPAAAAAIEGGARTDETRIFWGFRKARENSQGPGGGRTGPGTEQALRVASASSDRCSSAADRQMRRTGRGQKFQPATAQS